ncbi:uncharacterized protein LOC141855300 [Brevipalpus obovatus]|uniref:uncharacterized protein LOC141855300 n=1 Tax=Brevipalpus obovatus TaxID=246614 RepID=UPI003D9F2E6C
MTNSKKASGGDTKPATKDPSKVAGKQADKEYTNLLHRLRRWILFGCDEVYRSCMRRSIGRWFPTEENVRVYKKSFKINCIRLINQALINLADKGTVEDNAVRTRLLENVEKTVMENASHSIPGTVPFILSQMREYEHLRPLVATLINKIPLMSADLMLFNLYVQKIKGATSVIRRAIGQWYTEHTDNPEMIKDILLRKRRSGWTHADIVKIWHIPDNISILLKIVLGFPVDLTSIQDDERRKLVVDCLKLRNLNSKNVFLKLLEDEEYLDKYGDFMLTHIKSQLYCKEAVLVAVKRVSDNDLIQAIPRMLLIFPNVEVVLNALLNRLKKINSPASINLMSLWLTSRWLSWRKDKEDVKKKKPMENVLVELNRLLSSYPKSEDEVLIVAHWEHSMENFEEVILRRSRVGLQMRPAICPDLLKSVEFLCLLLFFYPNHRLIAGKSHYQIKSASNPSEILPTLLKIRAKTAETIPEVNKKISNLIMFALDNCVDNNDLKAKVQTYGPQRMVVITKDKVKTCIPENPIPRKTLVIHGFDLNFLSLIQKMFTLL